MTFEQWWNHRSGLVKSDAAIRRIAESAWNAHAELANKPPETAFDRWWSGRGNHYAANLMMQPMDSSRKVEAILKQAIISGWNAALNAVVDEAGTQYITVDKDRNCVVDDHFVCIADMYKS